MHNSNLYGVIIGELSLMKAYYDILELPKYSSGDKIKSQYLLMINAWHPDKFRNPEQKKFAEEKTKEINEAYDVLKDASKRFSYDQKLRIEEESCTDSKNPPSSATSHQKKTSTKSDQKRENHSSSNQYSDTSNNKPNQKLIKCWNCSTINRTSDKYCTFCGVDLYQKPTKPEPNLSFFGTFFKIGLIFSIVLLVLFLIGNYITNKNSTSNKVMTFPTSTQKPHPTLSPTEKPTLVPTKDPNVLFSDDFSVRLPDSEFFDEYSDMWYGDDESYYIKIKKPNYYSWLSFPITSSDVIIKTFVQQVDDKYDGYFGVVCRVSDQGNYFFHVYENGFYEVGKNTSGVSISITSGTLANPNFAGNINSIVSECVGHNLRLSVNGKLLIEVIDNSLTYGDVGVLVGAGDSGENTVKFLNLLVTKPLKSSESKLPSTSNCIPWDTVKFEDKGKYLCITGKPIRVEKPQTRDWDDVMNNWAVGSFRGAVYFDAGWGKLILEGYSSIYEIKVGECIKVQGYIYTSSSHPMIDLNSKDTRVSSCD